MLSKVLNRKTFSGCSPFWRTGESLPRMSSNPSLALRPLTPSEILSHIKCCDHFGHLSLKTLWSSQWQLTKWIISNFLSNVDWDQAMQIQNFFKFCVNTKWRQIFWEVVLWVALILFGAGKAFKGKGRENGSLVHTCIIARLHSLTKAHYLLWSCSLFLSLPCLCPHPILSLCSLSAHCCFSPSLVSIFLWQRHLLQKDSWR